MSGFDRLSPALQYQIANTLGWRSLRPVQEHAIDAILDGKNCVVLAPTAGGKTEAAFFPVLSMMDGEDWRPVSAVYLSPIRALLNNQDERVSRLGGLVGRRVFKWHGDVHQRDKDKFKASPTDALLTTPESLEAMLMSSRVPTRELFSGLRVVIVDEIHAFADDDRGAHLSALLERFTRICGRDVQRIGLSATVGNPEEILRWLNGSSRREGVVVDPGGEKKQADLALDFVGTIENAATVITQLHPGKKRLVFVDSRRKAEELGPHLRAREVDAFVTHGSLSLKERRDAERAFHEGENCVIVATSALELGIDVGDLDHVLQIDAPSTVASFLQRMGRTGRRDDARPNCTFLVTKEQVVLQAAALLALYRAGWVENVAPSRRASHILAHQLMALGIQLSGVTRTEWWTWLAGATAFADLTEAERDELLAHMLEKKILADHDGRIWLGEEGERLYGGANFRSLYAVFDAPRDILVRADTLEIGTVDAKFLASVDSGEERGSFSLAGRPWQIVEIEWERGICSVRPAPLGKAARWAGDAQFLSYELCQAMRRVLVSDDIDPAWSARAQRVLQTMRADHAFLRDDPSPMQDAGDTITWWTFAGGAANLVLARLLEAELGPRVIVRNLNLELREEAAKSSAAIRDVLSRLVKSGGPTHADALRIAPGAHRGRITKFEPCLPAARLAELVVATAMDPVGASRAVLPHRPPAST